MQRWYEKAVDSLEQEYQDGLLTSTEFQQAMREINQEYEAEAEAAGREARDAYY